MDVIGTSPEPSLLRPTLGPQMVDTRCLYDRAGVTHALGIAHAAASSSIEDEHHEIVGPDSGSSGFFRIVPHSGEPAYE